MSAAMEKRTEKIQHISGNGQVFKKADSHFQEARMILLLRSSVPAERRKLAACFRCHRSK
jgi:hypothetical protein